ncbi:cytochrome c maturation protein CcmE [Nocardiopsis tropica]|uniref:Cytochrome c maturation protein CcmE n=1 Tax=Nocardiopsis tropica TaxID=109330 RepID=A0ABU7KK51_9ACTN|nr:cytochrome c maturation protein CcmE [Nocardiopsis umidischolae]MEE2049673.1 cytochrome c maturation protein CcmE [Nocardiopsis umidischolae]
MSTVHGLAEERRPRTRLRLAVVVVAALAAVGALAASGLGRDVVFYRTPEELVGDDSLVGERVRLGGVVAPGSIDEGEGVIRFTLTDGADVPVLYTGSLVGVFQEGQGALVEGSLDEDGVFRGDLLMVRHDNTYEGSDGTTYTPPASKEDQP